jgi:hypothetical protein
MIEKFLKWYFKEELTEYRATKDEEVEIAKRFVARSLVDNTRKIKKDYNVQLQQFKDNFYKKHLVKLEVSHYESTEHGMRYNLPEEVLHSEMMRGLLDEIQKETKFSVINHDDSLSKQHKALIYIYKS